MRTSSEVAQVLELRQTGLGARRIAARTGLPISTVRDWLAGQVPRRFAPDATAACPACGHPVHPFHEFPGVYCYLLGLYLGDGCISTAPRSVYRLRVFLDLAYPRIVDECEEAMRAMTPWNRIHRLLRSSSYTQRPEPSHVAVSAYSRAWPCLFPQHGPGKKHEREIKLVGWQRALVQSHARLLLRGLIHSDGSRFINTGRGDWTCPRYVFNNKSDDIRRIFSEACDVLGLRHTLAPRAVYVSRKADVMRMDEFIGPKS